MEDKFKFSEYWLSIYYMISIVGGFWDNIINVKYKNFCF